MTPSRRPPLPICRGWPSSSETFSSSSTPVARMRTRSGSSSKRRATSAAGSPQRTRIAALQRLVLEHRADQAAQRGGGAADGDGLRRMLDLDPLEDVVDAVADLADLRRRGRVGGDQLVGEDAGADLPGAHLLGAAGDGAEDHLGRAAADVDDADLPSTGWPSVLVAPMKESRPSSSSLRISTSTPGGLADRLRRPRSPLRGLAHRGGGDGADRLGAQLSRQPHLGGDDLGDLSTFSAGIAPSSSIALLIRV